MPIKPTPQKTLKQEKLWYIDQDGKTVYYDVSKDTESGWWLRLNKHDGFQNKNN